MSVSRIMLVPTHQTGLANALTAALAEIVRADGQRVRYHHVGPLSTMSAWDRWEGAVFLDPSLYDASSLVALYDVATRGAGLSLLSTSVGILDKRVGAEWSPVDVAALLDCPLVIVVDCRGWGAVGLRALVRGIRAEVKHVNMAGVILTGLADAEQCRELQDIMWADGVPVLGCLLQSERLGWDVMPPGPWGLPLPPEMLGVVARQVNVRALQRAAGERGFLAPQAWLTDRGVGGPLVLVAGGRGFTLWSRDSIEVLRSAGARVQRLDLMKDETLPSETAGLVLAGTLWPAELTELAANGSLLLDIRTRIGLGLPTIALGGGLVYLLDTVQDSLGRTAHLTGVFPDQGEILWDLEAPVYVEVTGQRDSLLLNAGERVMGWVGTEVDIASPGQGAAAPFLVRGLSTEELRSDGVMSDNLVCSSAFIHLAGCSDHCERFVQRCASYTQRDGVTFSG